MSLQTLKRSFAALSSRAQSLIRYGRGGLIKSSVVSSIGSLYRATVAGGHLAFAAGRQSQRS